VFLARDSDGFESKIISLWAKSFDSGHAAFKLEKNWNGNFQIAWISIKKHKDLDNSIFSSDY
jgi:hypothetical protein